MGLLPKKTKPQEWTDVPLPGLEEAPVKQVREKSKKDEDDDAHRIKYRRYKGARSIVCRRPSSTKRRRRGHARTSRRS